MGIVYYSCNNSSFSQAHYSLSHLLYTVAFIGLDTVLLRMEILRFGSVFLVKYYLMKNKKLLTYVKQHVHLQKLRNCHCYGNNDVSMWRIKMIFS
jgi:hypothetical protein